MNRSRMAAIALAVVLGVPAILVILGLIPHPSVGLVATGDLLYLGVSALAIGLFAWRGRRQAMEKPLPAALTRQGLIVIMIGLSGLLALAIFAPRFPESALGAYLAGVASIVLFTLIPLGLLAYVRRKLS